MRNLFLLALPLLAACGDGGSTADETVVTELGADPAYEAGAAEEPIAAPGNIVATAPVDSAGNEAEAVDPAANAAEPDEAREE